MDGVVAVIKGEDLKAAGDLHWMPTLMSDTQMVLPIEKVVYYAQEVCVVLATEPLHRRRCGGDDPRRVRAAGGGGRPAQGARGQGHRPRRQGREDQSHLALGDGRQGASRPTRVFCGLRPPPSSSPCTSRDMHVSSIETCGMVANYNKATSHMQIYMTSQAPHAHRTVFALVSGLPEQKIQIISPDIGGGFGGKVPVYPGLCLLRCGQPGNGQTGQVDRGSKREPAGRQLCPRLPHQGGAGGGTRTASSPACGSRPWPITALPMRPPIRPSSRPGSTASAPAPTTWRRRMSWSMASTPTNRRAASPIAARSGSPKPCT